MKQTTTFRPASLYVSAAAFILAAALPAAGARAQNFERVATGITDSLQTAIDFLPEDVTNVRLGLGPDYEGSNNYNIDPVPVVSLRYKNFLEVDNNEVKLTAFKRLFDSTTGNPNGNGLHFGAAVTADDILARTQAGACLPIV